MSYDPLPDRDSKRQCTETASSGHEEEVQHHHNSSSSSMSPTAEQPPALRCLLQMKDDVVAEKEKTGTCTLSYWRFQSPEIWQALVDFASSQDWNYDDYDENKCRQEVQVLFTRMNQGMKAQEHTLIWCPSTVRVPNVQWSVVFGGKWADVACSIAEQLVDLLLSAEGGGDSRVYTVSRTPTCGDPSHKPPSNVVHLPKLNLELDDGPQEFEDVLNRVIDDWEKEHYFTNNGTSNSSTTTTTTTSTTPPTTTKTPIVFYFTLAKHKGNNLPFQRNIQAVNSFVVALYKVVPSRLIAKGIPWKVVITGTDATNPSTQEDPTLTVDGVPTTTPKYKIVTYNTVYAASKLGQFYAVAAAVQKMTQIPVLPPLESNRPDNDGSLEAITKQLEDFVKHSGANGTYQENPYLTDKELDAISNYWTQVVEPALSQNVQTAKAISICYTPLHRDPWTTMCLTDRSQESPKKFMIQNILWRLKNAISIDRAARAHL
jgi:hypothetical protein